ncbi:hypothetical protein CcaCcLH18_06938 [Colletotrichum camelliae]|nr:hypothetical protein CcaCcLH18_06938 [Colletotrichum camelliae]
MSLLGLPNELLQAIAVYCGVDGGGLARANRRLHDNTNDILWQSAIIDEESLTRITARAAQSGNLKTMKKAAAYGADFDLLHPVTWYQDMAEFDSATDLPDWRVGDELSQFWASPLHLAVYHNHYDTVEWLITVQGWLTTMHMNGACLKTTLSGRLFTSPFVNNTIQFHAFYSHGTLQPQ